MYRTYSMELAGRELKVEIGRVAEQANGAALVLSLIHISFKACRNTRTFRGSCGRRIVLCSGKRKTGSSACGIRCCTVKKRHA